MTTVSDEAARITFAQEAARHFAAHPEHWTYSRDELAPGVMMALRWGLGKDCVLVVRLDQNELVNFQQIIRDVRA